MNGLWLLPSRTFKSKLSEILSRKKESLVSKCRYHRVRVMDIKEEECLFHQTNNILPRLGRLRTEGMWRRPIEKEIWRCLNVGEQRFNGKLGSGWGGHFFCICDIFCNWFRLESILQVWMTSGFTAHTDIFSSFYKTLFTPKVNLVAQQTWRPRWPS